MHSSRGFFVSGQQQQIGFPVLMPNFCSFGLVASCYALQKRKKKGQNQTEKSIRQVPPESTKKQYRANEKATNG
jgi:hypothetical protein